MSDEQTIYISQEDDLTTVRERLEKIPTRRVTLVIPAQTQLRSHVAWKLLYARARELGKEVLIVSSDPQVRSVAHAVKFQVAHSLESTQPGKSRPASRPARTNAGSRGRASGTPSRSLAGRGPNEARGGAGSAPHGRQQASTQPWYPNASERRSTPSSFAGPSSRTDDEMTREFQEPISSSFVEPEKPYSQQYDFHIDTAPPIHPLTPEQIEEPDLLLEDYTQAQDIRQAASRPATESPSSHSGEIEAVPPANELVPPYRVLPLPNISDDPFEYMTDSQPPPLAEQRGAVSIEGYDTHEHSIQDAPDVPQTVIDNDIEYGGDRDDFVPPTHTSSITHSPAEPAQPPPDDEPEVDDPPRHMPSVRPRRGRKGYEVPASTQADFADDDLPHIEERPTQIKPPARPSVPLSLPAARASVPEPEPFTQGPRRPPAQSRSGQLAKGTRARPNSVPLSRSPQSRQAPSRTRSDIRRPASTRRKPAARSRENRGVLIGGIILLLLIVLAGGLVYFGPSANVTLTVAARNYALPISLKASANNQPGTTPAVLLSKDFTQSGTEPATGSQTEDTGAAKGLVCISNNGGSPIDIPSQITVATTNTATQFLTQEDTVMPANYKCGTDDPLSINIVAVKPGEGSNVPPGSITVIPDDSLNKIASYNKVNVNDLKLTVNNAQATNGGGVQTVPAVNQTDLDHAKTDLSKQLQGAINAWLQQLSAKGAIGQPVTTSTLVSPPAVNTIEENKNFLATVHTSTHVLFINTANLRKAALVQLNQSIRTDKNYTNYTVITDAQTPVTISQMQPTTGDTTAMTLKFNAASKAVPIIDKTTIQNLIKGTTVSSARTTLARLPNIQIQKVDITVTPGFMPLITGWPAHINVIEQTGSVQATK